MHRFMTVLDVFINIISDTEVSQLSPQIFWRSDKRNRLVIRDTTLTNAGNDGWRASETN